MSKNEAYREGYERARAGKQESQSVFDAVVDIATLGAATSRHDRKSADRGFRDGLHDRLREEHESSPAPVFQNFQFESGWDAVFALPRLVTFLAFTVLKCALTFIGVLGLGPLVFGSQGVEGVDRVWFVLPIAIAMWIAERYALGHLRRAGLFFAGATVVALIASSLVLPTRRVVRPPSVTNARVEIQQSQPTLVSFPSRAVAALQGHKWTGILDGEFAELHLNSPRAGYLQRGGFTEGLSIQITPNELLFRGPFYQLKVSVATLRSPFAETIEGTWTHLSRRSGTWSLSRATPRSSASAR